MRWLLSARPRFAVRSKLSKLRTVRNARTCSPLTRHRSTWRRVRWGYWMTRLGYVIE
jgi:hypothetical protein